MSERTAEKLRLLHDAAKVGTYVYLECDICGDTLDHIDTDRARLVALAVIDNWGLDDTNETLCGTCYEGYLEKLSKEEE